MGLDMKSRMGVVRWKFFLNLEIVLLIGINCLSFNIECCL